MKRLWKYGGILGSLVVVSVLLAATYNTAVYVEQGGAKQVVASGGELEIQSGGTLDMQSGLTLDLAGEMDVNSGGEIDVESGAGLDIESGGDLDVAGTLDINSGGDADVESGGNLDINSGGGFSIESGATWDVGGTTITADASEINKLDVTTLATDGSTLYRVMRSTYDATVDGGVSGTTYDLGEDLPANAIVVKNWFQVVTQFVDDASGTVAIQCAGANDLWSAIDITNYADGSISPGVADGTAANMFDVGTSACDISLVLGPANVSAGKLVHWVEYVVSE